MIFLFKKLVYLKLKYIDIGRLKTWSNIKELEQQLREDKVGSLRDHLVGK